MDDDASCFSPHPPVESPVDGFGLCRSLILNCVVYRAGAGASAEEEACADGTRGDNVNSGTGDSAALPALQVSMCCSSALCAAMGYQGPWATQGGP